MTRHFCAGVVMIAAGVIASGGQSGQSQPTLHPSHLVGSAAGTAQPGHVWHMKKGEVKTTIGWDAMPQWNIPGEPQKQVVALSMMVPTDWSFVGGPKNPQPNDCNFTSGRLQVMALSPDKKTGVIVMPSPVSMYSNNQQILQTVQMDNQRYSRMQQCKVEQPGPLASKIGQLVHGLGGGSRVVGQMEPIPGMAEKLPGIVQRANQQLASQGNGMSSQVQVEAGRVKITNDKAGGADDAYLAVMQVVRTDRMANGLSVTTIDYPMQVLTFTPAGQYAGMEKQFEVMLDSVWLNPQYQAACLQASANMQSIKRQMKQRISQIESQMAADNANAARQQAAIRAGVQSYSNQVHANVAANRSAALEHSSQQFAMYMGDQALYHDPTTGGTVQLPSGSTHAWASQTGNSNEYILTDSPSYNPNGQVGSASWTQMSEVR
jgi:hypothetical protein